MIKKKMGLHYQYHQGNISHKNTGKRKGGSPPNLKKILAKELLPIRSERQSPKNVGPQGPVDFNYRFS